MARSKSNQHNPITIGDGIRLGIGLFIAGLIPWLLFAVLGASGIIASLIANAN